MRLGPDESISYTQLSGTYLGLGRFDESKATINEAFSRKLDVPFLHRVLFSIAFAQNDAPAMQRELSAISSSSPDSAAFALLLDEKPRRMPKRSLRRRRRCSTAPWQVSKALTGKNRPRTRRQRKLE